MVDAIFGFDLGSSATKCLYKIPSTQRVSYEVMPPELFESVPEKMVEMTLKQQVSLGSPDPVEQAYIQSTRKAEPTVVGTLAQTLEAKPEYEANKAQIAIDKILAMIGAVAKKEELGHEFSLSLVCLLPLDEYLDSESMESSLIKALRSFYFQTERFQVTLRADDFRCKPEGFGFVSYYLHHRDYDIQNLSTMVVMLGHRNTSILAFPDGQFDAEISATEDLGFRDYIDLICQSCSGLEPSQELIEYVFKAGPAPDEYNFYPIVKRLGKDRSARHEMESRLVEAIPEARRFHWQRVKVFLEKHSLEYGLAKAIVAGGASTYFKEEIEDHFSSWGDDIVDWCSGLDKGLTESFGQLENHLAHRMTDLWALFYDFAQLTPEDDYVKH